MAKLSVNEIKELKKQIDEMNSAEISGAEQVKKDLTLSFDCEIIDPKTCENRLGKYSEYLFQKRIN